MYDTHAHLNYFKDPDLIARNAIANKIEFINNIGTQVNKFNEIEKLVNNFSNIYGTIGQHPDHIDEIEINDLKKSILFYLNKDINKKIVGIGETGLDYFLSKNETTVNTKQKDFFQLQIQIALERNLPIVVHTREAENDTHLLIKEYPGIRGVIHCFTGTLDFMRKMLDLGFYISYSGIVTFKKAETLKETLKFCPIDRLLVETDCPFLAPEPLRGKENKPEYITHTISFIANFLNINYEKLIQQTKENGMSLFLTTY